jgi:hypothetical protein
VGAADVIAPWHWPQLFMAGFLFVRLVSETIVFMCTIGKKNNFGVFVGDIVTAIALYFGGFWQ